MRKKAGKDFGAIKGIDRDEVKNSQRDVNEDKGNEERKKSRREEKFANKAKDGGEDKITGRAGNGNNGSVPARGAKVKGIKLNWFAPAKTGNKEH